MMGKKDRVLAPLPPVAWEELVPPPDHVSRHLERGRDLGFVRDLVRDASADAGRPSMDPVRCFTLQLILWFEGLRSERQLRRVVADRLSLRWYRGDLGYDRSEPRPDHSSLSRLRERSGLAVSRSFFVAIVAQGVGAGLVWGEALSIEATTVDAHAATDSLRPRFAVEAHLAHLCAPEEDDGAGVHGRRAPGAVHQRAARAARETAP